MPPGTDVSCPTPRCAKPRTASPGAMRGELSLGRGLRAAGIILVTEGAATVVLGIVLAAAVGGLAAVAAIIPFALGAWWLVKGTAALRIAEQEPARARQLNA